MEYSKLRAASWTRRLSKANGFFATVLVLVDYVGYKKIDHFVT